ncbi:MAG TPA: DUF2027 domain-containing protein [Sphingobacteriaceae bacterium]
MKFRLGEFVRFVDEKREGYITRIISDELLGVTGDDDFEIPVPANKVVRVHGREYSGVQDQSLPETSVTLEDFRKRGVFIAVVPEPSKTSVVNFHLINDTSFQLAVTLTGTSGDKTNGHFAGIVAPKSATKIYTASLPELNSWPQLCYQVLYFTKLNVPQPDPLVVREKHKGRDFAGARETVPILGQQGWLFRLDADDVVIDPEKLKASFFRPKEEKKEIERPGKEVDLHIEKLRDDFQFLSNREILRIQLDHFQKSLDAALVHKLPSMIFIHGVGNGTLRHEIHKVISKHPQVRTFMDAYKEKFGYGATEVIFK